MINKNKVAVFENLNENKKVEKLNKVASFLMDNDGEIMIYNDGNKMLYITEHSKLKIKIDLFEDWNFISETKAYKKDMSSIIIDSYSRNYEIAFGIGGIDFTDRLDEVSELMDYGDFHFILRNRFDYDEYIVRRSDKNPLDVRLYEYKYFEDGFYIAPELIPFSQMKAMAENKGYKIIGYRDAELD